MMRGPATVSGIFFWVIVKDSYVLYAFDRPGQFHKSFNNIVFEISILSMVDPTLVRGSECVIIVTFGG